MSKFRDLVKNHGKNQEEAMTELLCNRAEKKAKQIVQIQEDDIEELEFDIEKLKTKLSSADSETIVNIVHALFTYEQQLAVRYKKLDQAKETFNKWFGK